MNITLQDLKLSLLIKIILTHGRFVLWLCLTYINYNDDGDDDDEPLRIFSSKLYRPPALVKDVKAYTRFTNGVFVGSSYS